MRHEIVKEDDDRVRVRVEYIVLSGSEGYRNYSMLWRYREQSFFVLAGAPSRSRFAVDVYVRCEHGYKWEVESVVCILEGNLDVPVLDSYYSQERFAEGGGSDMPDQYPTKVEEYERTDTAALDGLIRREVAVLAIGLLREDTRHKTKVLTIIRAPVCQFHTTRVSSWSFQSVLVAQSSAS